MTDTGTIAAIGSLLVLVLGAVAALMLKWQRSQSEALAAQTKSVSDLLTATRGDADGTGRFVEATATGPYRALPMSCSPDCRADVLQAVKELREEVRTLAEEMRGTIGRHRVRLALLEREVSGANKRRRDDEADSDRPGR